MAPLRRRIPRHDIGDGERPLDDRGDRLADRDILPEQRLRPPGGVSARDLALDIAEFLRCVTVGRRAPGLAAPLGFQLLSARRAGHLANRFCDEPAGVVAIVHLAGLQDPLGEPPARLDLLAHETRLDLEAGVEADIVEPGKNRCPHRSTARRRAWARRWSCPRRRGCRAAPQCRLRATLRRNPHPAREDCRRPRPRRNGGSRRASRSRSIAAGSGARAGRSARPLPPAVPR